jgi:single-strand DNA-binding protein
LGKDPEFKEHGETQVAKFSLAVDKYNSEEPNWFRITAFGKNAVNLTKLAHKGDFVTVLCRAENSTYEKEGETRYSTDFIVDRWDLVFTGNTGNSKNKEEEEDYGF